MDSGSSYSRPLVLSTVRHNNLIGLEHVTNMHLVSHIIYIYIYIYTHTYSLAITLMAQCMDKVHLVMAIKLKKKSVFRVRLVDYNSDYIGIKLCII